MHKGRLEAFSDGVLAIILTIMVLELKVPHESDLQALISLIPLFGSYILSFIYIGIYWNNHHHLLQATKTVNGSVLWANLHLLFWLTLVPFTTAWMGENSFSFAPVVAYGVVLLFAGVAYYILSLTLVSVHGRDSAIAKALGSDIKGKASILLYILGLALSWVSPWLGLALYTLVALMWLIPDRRIEKVLSNS